MLSGSVFLLSSSLLPAIPHYPPPTPTMLSLWLLWLSANVVLSPFILSLPLSTSQKHEEYEVGKQISGND